MSLTPYQRIKKVMDYYYRKGTNKERVNDIYRKIISVKFKDAKYYENQFKPKGYEKN